MGEDGGLVVAAGVEAGPVEGDGDDEVDVGEVRSGGEAAAEEGAVVAPGGQVRVVLQGTRDGPVASFVMHQRCCVGIVHGLGPSMALKDRVEPVGHRIMRLEPIAGIWHVGRACQAQMPLAQPQSASADQACARHQQITHRKDRVHQPTRHSIHYKSNNYTLSTPRKDKSHLYL